MTMLDRMRRHKGWLKWSLLIVVVAFVAFYIPDLVGTPGATSSDVVASVDGQEVTVARFRRAYNQQIQAYRQMYGGQFDERMLRQLGIEQRIVQQMIEEEAGLIEAKRLGIGASNEEVRARIQALPAFQENGQFIGEQRYRQLLQMQNPPLRPDEFEEQVRRGITLEKLRGAITDWITVSDADVEAEFRRRNEKVKLAAVNFPADKFREGLTATDQELAAHFDKHKNDYKVPEKRKVKFALLDIQQIRERIQVTPEDVQRKYDENSQQYSTPEQVRASHILLNTEGKDDAAVKKRAEEILAKAKSGADFAKLATEYTEEEAGKARGGDLDFFGRGQMVPEFEKVAFSLQPGQISDVVKTQFGYHIIKVTDKRAATSRKIDEVRSQIEEQIKWERAQAEAERIANELETRIKKPEDLEIVAKPRGLTVAETPPFSREEPIAGLGMAPAVSDQAFELEDGQVSGAIRTPQGFAFITVTGREAARDPTLEEVKARVREDVVKQKAIDAARQKAAAAAAQLKEGASLEAAAKAAGVEAKTTDLIARGAPVGDAGVSPAIDAAAFALPVGGVSDPIVTDNGAVIVKVVEKKEVTPTELASGKQAIRDEMVNERRNRFYSAYMTKARDKMKININRETLAQLL